MERKRCKVVMLKAKGNSHIWNNVSWNNHKIVDDMLVYNPKETRELANLKGVQIIPRHLYIVSDDEIKEGDWVYNEKNPTYGKVFQCVVDNETGIYKGPSGFKKIIATTDKSLLRDKDKVDYFKEYVPIGDMYLPSPSADFIKKYCEAGGIDEVDVEYEYKTEVHTGEYVLKVDSHNTITTIHPVKDNWTREEVEALIRKYQDTFGIMGGDSSFVTSWIKENM